MIIQVKIEKVNFTMICRLEILLKTEDKLSYQMGTAFHGALMELISEETADILHTSQLHPYSQYLERRDDGWYWVITTLSRELSKQIIYDGILSCEGMKLKKTGIKVGFYEKQLCEVSMETLSERMYSENVPQYINLEFITPASFKQDGRYLFYPDIRAMYISLLNKYGAAQPEQNVRDEDLLEELVRNTRISRYNLRSVLYHVESGKVPSFIGTLSLRLSGTQTIKSFADFLFHLGEYSGIGIKGGLGMGGMRISDKENDKRREG